MDVVVLCDIISVNQQEVRENEVSSKWELIHLDLASSMMKDASTAFCDVEVLVVCKSCNKLPFFVEIVDFYSLICLRFSVTSAHHFLLCCKLFVVA